MNDSLIVIERNFKASLMMQSAKNFEKIQEESMATGTFIGEPLVVFENKLQVQENQPKRSSKPL